MRDLLQLARPLEPTLQSLDLVQFAEATVERMQGHADRADVRYRLLCTEKPHVSADRALLGLALENLLRNAAQVSPRDAEVRLIISSSDAGLVQLAVEDDGPGIAPADRPRIFEPFFTTRAVGTGLGLPIVKRLIEAHGGNVRLDDPTPGRGARFELSLPRI